MTYAVGRALLCPLASRPYLKYYMADGGWHWYQDSPKRYWTSALESVQQRLHLRATQRLLAFPWLLIALMTIGFVLLPVSRKSARVRWQHILRISLYSAASVIPLQILTIMHRGTPRGTYVQLQWQAGVLMKVCLTLIPLMLFIWWGCAISRHLKMRSPWLVALCVFLIAYLLPMVCGYFRLIVEQRPDWFLTG